MRKQPYILPIILVLAQAFIFSFCLAQPVTAAPTVKEVVDGIVARLYAETSLEDLAKLDNAAILSYITPEEREVLETKYWGFDIGAPAIVSVMRDREQPIVPFWLEEQGFEKTALKVRNEKYTYEVWQKIFPAGHVGLGINGFDNHRPHYFVTVGRVKKASKVDVSNFAPPDQQVLKFTRGSYVYIDWPDLPLTHVPETLEGQTLLPTIRGRSREAHLTGDAFRMTKYRSAASPDQIALTFGNDPKTGMNVQWRTDVSSQNGSVFWRKKDGTKWMDMRAKRTVIEDRMLANNPKVAHFTAELKGLEPGTVYEYTVGGDDETARSVTSAFTTAPADSRPFTFLWMSDTHNRPETEFLLETAAKHWPEAAFLTVSGDNVGTGQYRDDWDKLLAGWSSFIRTKPYMPSMGNHDTIDGLGPDLYLSLFDLPKNGPEGITTGRAYSLRYGNALLIMLDVTESAEKQVGWLEKTLKDTDAVWKFAVFHFPPFDPDGNEPDIKKCWVPLFDKYHVDFALSGHVHHYLRTKPMRDGKVVGSPKEGTIYCVTVSIPGDQRRPMQPKYADAVDFSEKAFCSGFTVDGNRCTLQTIDQLGNVTDEMIIEK